MTLSVDKGERICLVGRNGTGKSTLFRLIDGSAQPDDGSIWIRDGMRISKLDQEVPPDAHQTIYERVSEGLGELGRLLAKYHRAAHIGGAAEPHALNRLSELQHAIEARGGWNVDQRVKTVISRLSLPADHPLAECSGGIRRRAMLARALVAEPDLLLLDEPTNHMDITSIVWLEDFLLGYTGALMFITHDRTLVRRLATRIIELDRGQLRSYPGNYDEYARRKGQELEAESRTNARFDRKLAEEEIWIRKGIKARRTRNEGRVRQLWALREERQRQQERVGHARLEVDGGQLSGKLVADLDCVSVSFAERTVIDNLSTRILRGDRIGIVGPNGCGKSTLLRLILGDLTPDSGRVVTGSKLQVAYFDQQRMQLDLAKSVRENIGGGADYVRVGERSRHVIGYLRDFLFPAARADSPVSSLSGGERNRLLLARLFTRPANLMVLDEPTNDLDVDTLELLEDLLADYAGTLLLVSHDRAFLDNVVTSTLVFEEPGVVREYIGGYGDWLRRRQQPAEASRAKRAETSTHTGGTASARRKIGYNEKRELEALPQRIEELEAEQQSLESITSNPEFFRHQGAEVHSTLQRLTEIGDELAAAYARWEHLDNLPK